MEYIIIENLDVPTIDTNEDGNVIIYQSLDDARIAAEENLQVPIIVPLSENLMSTLVEVRGYIDITKFEFGKEGFDTNGDLEARIINLTQ